MEDEREVLESLLADKPGAKNALEELLEVDDSGPWTFDDISVDSGLFGELVSRGIVSKTDGEYRLANPDVVKQVLSGSDGETGTTAPETSVLDVGRDHDGRVIAVIGASLLFVALIRTVFIYDSVFRTGHIVLAGNDPYYYLFWVERLLESDLQAFDVGSLSNLPEPLPDDEVLMLVTIWWFAALLGGTQSAAVLATAAYPVIAAVLIASIGYVVAVKVTEDRRIGLLTVLFMGITPTYAVRTALGFGDHHPFDYLLLMITAYGVVHLATEQSAGWNVPPRDWVAVLAVGFGVAGQVHAWRGGPIMLLPIAVYAGFRPAIDLRADRNPLAANRGLLLGLALGAALSWQIHALLGWSGIVRVVAPGLVLLVAVATVLVGTLIWWGEFPNPGQAYLLSGTVTGAITVFLTLILLPNFVQTVDELVQFFRQTGQSNITETASLVSSDFGYVFGPIFYFGLLLYLALPYMGWAVYRSYDRTAPGWLALSVYAWYFFLLSALLQIRFGSQLALFSAIFASLGFVHVAERIDLTDRPAPFEGSDDPRGTPTDKTSWIPSLPAKKPAAIWILLFVLVGGLSIAQVPIKMQDIAIDDASYQTGVWLESEAPNESDQEPAYVFSVWDENRYFNYMAGTDYRSYDYAQRNYNRFLSSTSATAWATRLRGRNAYVVTKPTDSDASQNLLQVRLHEHLGSGTNDTTAVTSFRLLYVSPDGSRKVFEPTTAAVITGQATPNTEVTISTEVSVPGKTFTYERRTVTGANGTYSVAVPYSGEYDTPTGSVYVSEDAIRNESFVSAPESDENTSIVTKPPAVLRSDGRKPSPDATLRDDDAVLRTSYYRTELLEHARRLVGERVRIDFCPAVSRRV